MIRKIDREKYINRDKTNRVRGRTEEETRMKTRKKNEAMKGELEMPRQCVDLN